MTAAAGAAPLPSILVVDDELGYREGIRRILTGRGYTVSTAGGGAEAIALATEHDFPVVLVDLKMPDVDGFEVIEALRLLRPRALPIVVSAFATIESAVQTTKMGAFDFVVKPFVPDDLLVVVERAADKWRLALEAERLRAEREGHLLELAAEKSRLRTIVQSMAEGLLVVNIDGNVVLDAPLCRRLLGRVQAEPLSGQIAAVLPDEHFLTEIGKLLGGAAAETVSLEIVRPGSDGADARYLRATLAPVHDEAGALLGVAVLLADITDAKALERMKLLFVSMVAHELKAPIGAVEGYLELLESGALDADPARRSGIIHRCLERTGALLELIRDLTEIVRRDAGRQERRIGPVDLGAVCGALVNFNANEAARRQLTVELALAPGVPAVLADKGDLERVVTNLLSNAIKYNRAGGRVAVRLGLKDGLVCLEVEDTGIGMSDEDRRRIGEDFFRAKNEQTRTITGTGLGLALVKKIVDGLSGALEVESRVGVGSTFRVLLPPAQPALQIGAGHA